MKGRAFFIGASTGGLDALRTLLAQLPADFPAPILITQHVGARGAGQLPRLFGAAGRLPASHATDNGVIEPGHVYVAPPDRHLLVHKGRMSLSHGPRENFTRPAIDPFFRSAATAYGPTAVGIVLTGQLDDGTAGLLAIKDCGGTAIVQDPREAVACSMPASAQRHVAVDHCCTLAEMGALMIDLANDDPPADPVGANAQLLQAENEIAAGALGSEGWRRLEQWSSPSGLNCPTCRSALYEMKDTRVLRFRCRAGHAFSAQSLFQAQAEVREASLQSLFGALMEQTALMARMQDTALERGEEHSERQLRHLRGLLEHEGSLIADWLRTGSDGADRDARPPDAAA